MDLSVEKAYRQASDFVVRILNGAKPADLDVRGLACTRGQSLGKEDDRISAGRTSQRLLFRGTDWVLAKALRPPTYV